MYQRERLPNEEGERKSVFTPSTVVWGNVLYLDFNNPSLCCVVIYKVIQYCRTRFPSIFPLKRTM